MKWYSDLYVGEGIQTRKDEVVRSLEEGDYDAKGYMITLAANGVDYLDIRKISTLRHPGLKGNVPMIVGLADSQDEAIELTAIIAQDSLDRTGSADIRSFLEQR